MYTTIAPTLGLPKSRQAHKPRAIRPPINHYLPGNNDFALPGRIDLLLGAYLYADVMMHGRRCGPHGTPTAIETGRFRMGPYRKDRRFK